ncbi:hypothetical protein B0O80DRAFT_292219 [Mortierella sp. GBAus27b]|nr:hypothetical protein B0O80DRAFT_292219 [Mortierella sp. GBAus27b]
MSAFLLPASCRCPQRSMLSHFAASPVSTASRTRTRVTTTTSRSWSMLTLQKDEPTLSSLGSQPYLLNTTTRRSETKVFAPLYQTDVPLPPQYRYQLPYSAPPVPTASPEYLQQQSLVHPSHQLRVKRQPSLKHASYASRTIPLMMGPVPQEVDIRNIQLDRDFLDMAKQRLEDNKEYTSHHFDYCKDKPLREAAVLMVS